LDVDIFFLPLRARRLHEQRRVFFTTVRKHFAPRVVAAVVASSSPPTTTSGADARVQHQPGVTPGV
jgi:hypothetical protein